MIEWLALIIGSVALALNILFVRKIGKVVQAINAAEVAFNAIRKDAQEAMKTVSEAKKELESIKYWKEKKT